MTFTVDAASDITVDLSWTDNSTKEDDFVIEVSPDGSTNWTQADAIRKHMTDLGLSVLDNKDGTTSLEKDGQEIVRV